MKLFHVFQSYLFVFQKINFEHFHSRYKLVFRSLFILQGEEPLVFENLTFSFFSTLLTNRNDLKSKNYSFLHVDLIPDFQYWRW